MRRDVELGSLVVDFPPLWINPRTFTGLDKESLDELGSDLKTRGIQDPLTVQRVTIPGEDGILELVLDGQRRVKSAERVGFKKGDRIPVVDFREEVIELTPKTASQLLIDIMATGTYREPLSSFEQSAAAERLKAEGASGAAIGKAIRRSESWVSRMLKARANATPQLLAHWKAGRVTDEMFKDLSEVKPAEQDNALADITQTRGNGTSSNRKAKAEARARTKEIAQKAKAEKPKKEPKRKAKAVETKPAPKHAPPSKLELQELADLGKKRTATSDYVKGLIDCARYAVGEIGPDKFAKAWRVFLARIEGSSKPSGEKPKPEKKVSKKEQRKRDKEQVKKALAKGRK